MNRDSDIATVVEWKRTMVLEKVEEEVNLPRSSNRSGESEELARMRQSGEVGGPTDKRHKDSQRER
jgi:hypothetical protein